MNNSYKLNEILTPEQFDELRGVLHGEEAMRRQPHAALMRWLEAQPAIMAKLERRGLLPAFFAYQLEHLLSQIE